MIFLRRYFNFYYQLEEMPIRVELRRKEVFILSCQGRKEQFLYSLFFFDRTRWRETSRVKRALLVDGWVQVTLKYVSRKLQSHIYLLRLWLLYTKVILEICAPMNCYTHANLAVEGEEAKMEHLRGLGGPSENTFWASLKILFRLHLSPSENIAWASLEPLWKCYLIFTVAALLNTSIADSSSKQIIHNVEFLFKCIIQMRILGFLCDPHLPE